MSSAFFNETLDKAVADLVQFGYSEDRVKKWSYALRWAMEKYDPSFDVKKSLEDAYKKATNSKNLLKSIPDIDKAKKFTLEQIKPQYRGMLEQRIKMSADLIKLNRTQAIESTLRRFSGWASSIPEGGSEITKKRSVKFHIAKEFKDLPFTERRVAIDQGHKLMAAVHESVAMQSGAIAGMWHSHWRQAGYNYRVDHKERDQKIYIVRDSWAHKAKLVKPGKVGYIDEITRPGEEVFCRCSYEWITDIESLPDDMLTKKGKELKYASGK